MASDWRVPYAKLVGCSFGINEMTDSREEEGRKLKFICCPLSGSKVRVEDTKKGNLHGSSSDNNVGTYSTGCGSGLGFSRFSTLHGRSCGFSEGVNLNKKEGRLGMNGKREHGTSQKNQKRAALEEDPDWLPEQGSFIQSPDANNRGDLVGKRSKMNCNRNGKNPSGKHDGVDVSKPGQSTPAPNNLKHLLLSAGWTFVSQQGLSDLLYVSPSGSVYGSLPKALEAFSLDASEFRKKEQGSYQSVHSGGICSYSDLHGHSLGSKHVVKNIPKVKETVYRMDQIGAPAKPVSLEDILLWDRKEIKESSTNPVEMVSSGLHNMVACCKVIEKAQSRINNGSFSSETKKLNYSTVVMSNANHQNDVEIQQCDSSIGVLRSVLINGKIVPVGNKTEMEIREDEDFLKSSECEKFMTGNLLLQKPQNHKETLEALPVPDETGCKQVYDVVAVDEKVNQEKRNPDGCRGALIKDKQSNVNIIEDSELHGVRRSKRINGRHVPVHTELNLEFWDDDQYLDSCDSVNMFTKDVRLGTQEPDNKIDKEASPMPTKIRYKEVNEVFSSITDVKTLLEKQKPDEEIDMSGRSTELNKGLVFQLEDESTFMDFSSQDMLPLDPETDTESDSEALTERRYREVHDILASSMVDGKATYRTESTDCSSDRAQKLDSTGALVVNNGKDRNGNMHQHSEVIEIRRSTRINGKHVPVDTELDVGLLEFDDFIGLSSFVDDTVEKKDKEKSANSNSKMVDIVFCLPASGFVDDRFGKKVRERSSYSISEMKNIVMALPAPGFLKQAATTNSDCQTPRNQGLVEQTATTKSGNHKARNQELLDSNDTLCMHGKVSKKYDREETPVAEQGSSLLMNNGTKALKQTATRKSDNQKPRNQEQLEQTAAGKSDNQKPRNQEQLDSNSLPCMHGKKKCAGVMTLVAEKEAPSLLRNGTKVMLTEKQSPLSLSKRKRDSGGYSNGKKKKKRSGGCGLVVRRTGKGGCRKHRSETKYSMLSWLIDNNILAENEKVVYKIKNDKGNIMKGCITRGGIRCNCCRKVWSLLEFEAHAGNNIRQPWMNTCLISGKSLMQCQSEAWEREKKERKVGFHIVGAGDADPSDDTCGICADGGHLICCDGCLSTFHQECVMLKSLPEGSWYCPFCRCAFCMLADRGQDKPDCKFSMFSCNQCGCKYHRDCVLEKDKDEILSFCGENCQKVALALSNILGVSNPLDGGFSWTLLKRLDEDDGTSSDQSLSFIMECNVKLALALSVLDECFVPLVDPRTGLDMIVQAVYNCGSNYNRLNCERFYTMVLEKDDEIISVATLRLHGTRLAEMPFIGTRPIYRRKGMCRRLFNAIEKMLSSLHVEKLIIPAIPDLLGTWMTSFFFKPLESSHREEIRNLNMMIFADTTLLQKSSCNMETNEASGRLALLAISIK
ncbi:uncharacterized protein LOC122648917 isoform X2 [Telopea speciosissima]|uniref:uncharacterized protein LOC122648917 isoform X2 n=1 Tax=Telopea speciosissima TaxID=54955 RepID=UPI001CC3B513|nr:uncharacterized protein LOC122648917 isoform X2 [Telopea speciosissima]